MHMGGVCAGVTGCPCTGDMCRALEEVPGTAWHPSRPGSLPAAAVAGSWLSGDLVGCLHLVP